MCKLYYYFFNSILPNSIIALSVNFFAGIENPLSYPQHILAIHSSKRLLVEQISPPAFVLADTLINLTLAKGQRHEVIIEAKQFNFCFEFWLIKYNIDNFNIWFFNISVLLSKIFHSCMQIAIEKHYSILFGTYFLFIGKGRYDCLLPYQRLGRISRNDWKSTRQEIHSRKMRLSRELQCYLYQRSTTYCRRCASTSQVCRC